jgi:membrane-bound metal-dependent hydrolase YbcI (DUF457 family)
MDILTHVLTGALVGRLSGHGSQAALVASVIGAVLPDIGEVPIQRVLSRKYRTILAVYDSRTSDLAVARDSSVTWVYDLLHSLVFCAALLVAGIVAHFVGGREGVWLGSALGNIAAGVLSHILLDTFTHGDVWAIKLFYPFFGRLPSLPAGLASNWWEWKPAVILPGVKWPIPYYSMAAWAILILLLLLL